MTQTTLEYVLNSMYIALVSAIDARQRALANDTMARCADLPCAPVCAPEFCGELLVTRKITKLRLPDRDLSLTTMQPDGCVIA
jgi:hypothetical protein